MQNEITDILEFPVTENYSPEVSIEIIDAYGDSIKRVAIVDTGSTGFLQMPMSIGISAHLRLWASRPAVLADKRTITNLICVGTIKFAGKELFGFIRLSETNDECILGMQFLKELGMDFTVSPRKKRAIFTPLKASEDKQITQEAIVEVSEKASKQKVPKERKKT